MKRVEPNKAILTTNTAQDSYLAIFFRPCFRSEIATSIEEPWGSEFSFERPIAFGFPLMSQSSIGARKRRFNRYMNGEEIVFAWIAKHHWGIPDPQLRKKVNKGAESRALFLISVLILCEKLHPFLSKPYQNYAHLFTEVKLDFDQEFAHICFDSPDEERGNKAQDIKFDRNRIALLKKGKNPYCPINMPTVSRLIDVALRLGYPDASEHPKYFAKEWRDFIKKYRLWISDTEKNGYSYFFQGDHEYKQVGRGREIQKVKNVVVSETIS